MGVCSRKGADGGEKGRFMMRCERERERKKRWKREKRCKVEDD